MRSVISSSELFIGMSILAINAWVKLFSHKINFSTVFLNQTTDSTALPRGIRQISICVYYNQKNSAR